MAPASGYPGEATGDARGKAKKGKAGQRGVERGGRTLLRMNRLASVVRLYLAPSQVKLESVGLRIFWKRQFHRLAEATPGQRWKGHGGGVPDAPDAKSSSGTP